MTAERARLQKLLRVALLLQAVGGLGIIAQTVPDFIDAQRALECGTGWCLDFRGIAFKLAVLFIGPFVAALLFMSWRWRGPRLWPLAIVVLIDAAAIFTTAGAIIPFLQTRSDSVPSLVSVPPLLLLPALATLALGVAIVRPVPLRPILAVSVAGCVILAAFFWVYAVRPEHQGIPGELSLPFSHTTVYAGRDLGCRDYVAGWVDEHECMRATLLVYRGSGDPSKDQTTINTILLAQQRIPPGYERVTPLPLDMAVNRGYGPTVDSANAGLCLIITDRSTPPRLPLVLGRCGLAVDYSDIRSNWPADDPYAIGIIYHWDRPDYVDQHSVTFLNSPLSAQPGRMATLRVHADANARCTIDVVDATGQSGAQGLDPKTTDSAGNVAWTWLIDASTPPGQWPITVTCGTSSGRTSWFVGS